MNLLADLSAHPVIGHRGAAAYAPENTLESFRLALELGAEALELDVRRSADGEAMVFHDATLERTTDGTGPLTAQTRAALATLDAGYRFTDHQGRFPFRGTGLRIPTLREVIARFPWVPLMVELKEREVQGAVERVLIECDAADHVILAADEWQALQAFRFEPFTLGASRRDITRLYFRLGRPDDRCRCYAVPDSFHGLPIPTRRFVQAAHARQATVHVWTVDDARTAVRLWANGVNGIVTNRPDTIRAARPA